MSSRREFILSLLSGYISSHFTIAGFQKTRAEDSQNGVLIAPYKKVAGEKQTQGILTTDLDRKAQIHHFDLPFLPHSVVKKPRSNTIITIERHGRHMAEIDIAKNQIIKVHQTPERLQLYGHFASSELHNLIIGTASEKGQPLLMKVDFNHDFQYQKLVDLPGQALLHDCSFLSDDQHLIAAKGSTFYIVDVKKTQLVDRIDVPFNIAMTHLNVTQNEVTFAFVNGVGDSPSSPPVPTPGIGSLNLKTRKATLFHTVTPKMPRMTRVPFGFKETSHGLVGSASPDDNRIHLWQRKTGDLLFSKITQYPTGANVTRDGQKLVFLSNEGLKVFSDSGQETPSFGQHGQLLKDFIGQHESFQGSRFFHSTII